MVFALHAPRCAPIWWDSTKENPYERGVKLGDESSDMVDAYEQGAKFVQWAEYAATDPVIKWATKQANTTYNLQKFWDLKSAHYEDDPNSWDELDLRAQKAWAALSNVGLVMDNPPAQDRYAKDAATATANAKEIALRLGKAKDAALLDKRAAENAVWAKYAKEHGVDDSYKTALLQSAHDFMSAGAFGIPWWGWALGGVAVLLMVRR